MAIETATVRFGKMMFYDTDIFAGRSYRIYGESHEDELSLIRRCTKDGDWIVDVGANIGSISVPCAMHVGEIGRVYAFEPQPKIYDLLRANIALNNLSNVVAYNKAVFDGSVDKLYSSAINYEEKRCFGSVDFRPEKLDDTDIEVEVVTIDSLKLSRCDYIKIDVEGSELGVLRGALQTIERCRPILQIEAIWNSDEITEFVHSLNYNSAISISWMYNRDNFNGVVEDCFMTDDGRSYVSKDLICAPLEKKISFC